MSKNGQFWYYVNAFLIIFMLQATLSLVVNAATLYQTAYHGAAIALGWKDYLGWGIFRSGFLMEALSDH